MPPPPPNHDLNKPKKPESLKDVPRYLKEVFGGFFSRLFYIFRLVWETRRWILLTLLALSVIEGVVPLVGALISSSVLNELAKFSLGTGDRSLVLWLLIFQFVYLILSNVISRIQIIVNRMAGELLVSHIRLKIMKKASELDLSSFDRPKFYEKLENANREAGMRPMQILSSTFSILSSIISLVSFITVIFAVSPVAPLLVIAVSIPSAVINFVYRKKNFFYMRFRSKERRKMDYYANLVVDKDLAKEVRLYSTAPRFIDAFREVFRSYFRGLRRLIFAEGMWNVGLSVLSAGINCILFYTIAVMVMGAEIPVGDYVLYTGALTSISTGVAALIATSATIYEGTLFIDNMLVFMNEPSVIRPSLATPRVPERGVAHEITFSHVSFSYPGVPRKVLDDVSFTIRAGESVALVGENGAGKTTLIKLLTRLYDPTEGVILLDGHDIREYDHKELYRVFGIIFQDFGKYAFDVRENITMGDVFAPVDEVRMQKAAEDADAADYISRLPRGFDTPLTRFFEPDGIELSIGQWQKLSVARAFYAESDVIILDEPTASLDALAEREIYREFDELRVGKTTLFVSHRLSSATTADKILVLEYGKLVEEGTHADLMEKQGRYHELFTAQAERYQSENNK
ncbi:MAG: ABC transporter ATP-binding protein, partial [Clostridia bacterium]|nr:ABC transporter ATP-binding protein [Clostridia bacterium]